MLLLNSNLEQVNITLTRRDNVVAFWYTAEGPSYIRS